MMFDSLLEPPPDPVANLAAAGYYDETYPEPDPSDGCAGGEHAGLLAYPGDPDSCEECGAAL